MATNYELTYIVRPDLDDTAKKALIERFDKVLSDNGATVVKSEDWESRKLAYVINGYREGLYHIVTFTSEDNKATNEFDRLAKISQDILRHMFVTVDFDKLNDAKEKSAAAAVRAAERRAARDAERSSRYNDHTSQASVVSENTSEQTASSNEAE
jgi:small subunit ribosomal protein S6